VALKNIRVGQPWRVDLNILVHAVNRLWPGEVHDARSLVTVLGMGRIEANRQAKRGIAFLLIDKLDRAVAGQFRLMAQRAIRLLFQVGVAANWMEGVKHRLAIPLGDIDAELADEAGAIAGPAQHRRVAHLDKLADDRRRAEGVLVRPLVKAGQEGARLAAQIDVVTNMLLKRTPSLAKRCIVCVFKNGCPAQPMRSQRWSSDRKNRMLGRSAALARAYAGEASKKPTSPVSQAIGQAEAFFADQGRFGPKPRKIDEKRTKTEVDTD
jgi:hypothetical protein